VPSITAAQPRTSIGCPNCGKSGSIKSQLPLGAKVRCRRCGHRFEPAIEIRGRRQRAGPPGLTLMTRTRLDHARLVVHCCCGGQVPYPGRKRDGSNPLAECPDCDLYFEVHDRDVLPASSRPGRAAVVARCRSRPA
jgi:hypothetical protein